MQNKDDKINQGEDQSYFIKRGYIQHYLQFEQNFRMIGIPKNYLNLYRIYDNLNNLTRRTLIKLYGFILVKLRSVKHVLGIYISKTLEII